MNTRRMVCVLLGHRYAKAYFPDSDAGEFLLRCRRCGKERDYPGNPDPGYYAWSIPSGG